MIDAFTNQTQRTAKQVEDALNDMITIIGGADYYSTAKSSAMRAKQINATLANDLINELDSEVSASRHLVQYGINNKKQKTHYIFKTQRFL